MQVLTKDGHVTGLVLCRTEQTDAGEWVEDEEQVVSLKCNYIISAFGSHLASDEVKSALKPLAMERFASPRPR